MGQGTWFQTGKGRIVLRILAFVAAALVLLPVIAPIVFSASAMIGRGVFRFDYLMPAELFPLALGGGCLLLWVALRARLHQKLIGWAFGAALLLLIGGQSFAVFSGLASGETEPTGWQGALAMGAIVAYAVALVVLGIGGILLVFDLFKRPRESGPDSSATPQP